MDARDDSDEVSSIYLGWIHDTVMSLGWIASYPQMELKQRIQGRLERIVKKHAPLDKQKTICEKVGITCLLAEEIKELRKQHLANLGIANEPPM